MTRWLSYIRLFDFDVKHTPGNKNGAVGALSRSMATPNDSDSDDADAYFEGKMYVTTISDIEDFPARLWLHEAEY